MPDREQTELVLLRDLCARQQHLIALYQEKHSLLTNELDTTKKLLSYASGENDTLRRLVCPVN